MLNTRLKKNPIDLGTRWLLNSGIQSNEGGFYSWYNLKDASYPFIYTEITGYGITTLLFFYQIFKNNIFLEKAKKAAGWILESAVHPCGGVKTRLYKNDNKADGFYSFSGENIFSFDTGMVLYAIINLYKITKEKKFLDKSIILADFLIKKMQDNNGSLFPIYNAKTDKIIETQDKWSNQRGSFRAKVSLGLIDLFEITEDKIYKDLAVRLCEYALSMQEGSGRFITDKINKTTHLHPHCYTAEGLLYTGSLLGNAKFIKSATKAAEWAFKYVTFTGINELYDPLTNSFNRFQRSDILSQLLRLGLIFSFDRGVDYLKSLLLEYQYLGDDINQEGAFLYTKDDSCLNSWCTMFALQALSFCQNKDLVTKEKKMSLLI